jgi:ketosteroid isomerase-like protein
MADERLTGRIRGGIEGFNRSRRIDTSFLAPGFELHQASSIIDTAGVFRGPDALAGAMRELDDAFDDLTFEAEDVVVAPGGEVVALIQVSGRGKGSGVRLDNRIAWVWTFRAEQATRLVVYEEPADALAATGLGEEGRETGPAAPSPTRRTT